MRDRLSGWKNGMMVGACNVHGIWYTEQTYLNFTLRFDYKFVPPAGWDKTLDSDLYQGQGGYFIWLLAEHCAALRQRL